MRTGAATVRQFEGLLRPWWARAAYRVVFASYLAGLVLWLALGLLPLVASGAGPFRQLTESVASGTGPLSGPAAAVLMHLPSMPSGLWVAAQYLFSTLNLALGAFLAIRRPYETVPQLVAIAFIGTAGTFNDASHSVFHLLGPAPVLTAVHFTFHVVSGVAYLWAVLLFPDGRLPSYGRVSHSRVAGMAAVGTALIAVVCWRSSFIAHPPFFVAFFGVLVPIVGIAVQSARLRAADQPPEARQQSRLLRLALAPALAAAALWLAVHAAGAALGSSAQWPGPLGAAVETVFPALFALVPVVLFVAILRYRLWEIDVALSRTLLVALLAGFVGLVYLVVLGITGWLFRDSGWSAVIAMTVVALALEPVRQACRRLANRLVFGQELTPREALRSLADRLTRTSSTDELAELTSVVVSGTRATSAAVWLVLDDRLLLAAGCPAPAPGTPRRLDLLAPSLESCAEALPGMTCLPVRHDGGLIAVLALTTPAGVALPAAERRLTDELARHAGLLVANARLTGDLAEQVRLVGIRDQELRVSRQKVVMAQDGERRRLERDIHDGAQQELVAFLVQLGILQRSRTPVDKAGQVGAELLETLHGLLHQARETLRELASGHLPPPLVEHGLDGALESAAAVGRGSGLEVRVDCRLPQRLPPAVEAAVYFCCREALQNATKHARARTVWLDVHLEDGGVAFSVSDDGAGFDAAGRAGDAGPPGGSGLTNVLSRLAAVGGTASVSSRPGAGTRVEGLLPLAFDDPTVPSRPPDAMSGAPPDRLTMSGAPPDRLTTSGGTR